MTNRYRLTSHFTLPLPLDRVFPFFASAEHLALLTPPELAFRLATRPPIEMREGTRIDYTIRIAGVRLRWRSEITRWDPPREFVDRQARGPYAFWEHAHRFYEVDGETMIEDVVDYRLPLGLLGRVVHPLVRRHLDAIFRFRSQAARRILCPTPPATPASAS